MAKRGAPAMLGPFLGAIDDTSVKIWLHRESPEGGAPMTVTLTVHPRDDRQTTLRRVPLVMTAQSLFSDVAIVRDLQPDTAYAYRLWTDAAATVPLDLEGLKDEDLWFRTLPRGGYDTQLDFLLMSCHNPFQSPKDDFEGHAVWARIPDIIDERRNGNVRFALVTGDQVYADDVETRVLRATDDRERIRSYVEVYRRFWHNLHLRRVLCRLPVFAMWDDHDITDGWGSREDSFVGPTSTAFKTEWRALFEAARTAFTHMQATSRDFPSPRSRCSTSSGRPIARTSRGVIGFVDRRAVHVDEDHRAVVLVAANPDRRGDGSGAGVEALPDPARGRPVPVAPRGIGLELREALAGERLRDVARPRDPCPRSGRPRDPSLADELSERLHAAPSSRAVARVETAA